MEVVYLIRWFKSGRWVVYSRADWLFLKRQSLLAENARYLNGVKFARVLVRQID